MKPLSVVVHFGLPLNGFSDHGSRGIWRKGAAQKCVIHVISVASTNDIIAAGKYEQDAA